jgi:P-type Ca2+ transporter type 2C
VATATRWHAIPFLEVAQALRVDPARGLDAAEARRRLAATGGNELDEAPPRSLWAAIFAQLRDPLAIVLLLAACVAWLTGDATDAAMVLAIVALDATIGCAQELRADRAVRSLRALLPSHALARRNGVATQVAQREIVPGDVVLLDAGATVPADMRLLEAHALSTQEAALTGESQPVDKTTEPVTDERAPIAEQPCMAWKGTLVVRGRGEGVAVATGMETELGRIARLLGEAEAPPTPLQRRLATFGRRASLFVVAVAAFVFVSGWLRGEPLQPLLLLAVSVAVAAIPEALPAVVTIALALAARRMAQRHALVRTLPAVETLGSVTFVCADKTGTLTENRMRVRSVWRDANEGETPRGFGEPCRDDRALLRAFALCHDAAWRDGAYHGDPTETALAEAAHAHGRRAEEELALWPRVAELPFDPSLQRMTTVHAARRGGRWLAVTKGSPEAVLPRCALDDATRDRALAAARVAAATGKRVLAFAQREGHGQPPSVDTCATHMRLLGLAALEDPPRPGARAAVRACRDAGIVPVMITGDHPSTARSVAEELGMIEPGGIVVTGRELEAWDDARLDLALANARRVGLAFARTTPEHKLRIVEALQRRGEVVAMTGDGVNDAPALQTADIGVAMGMRGTDVARQAADLALLDDDFATIPAAVEEGRRMHDAVRRFVRLFMAGNGAELLVVAAAPALGLATPLLPVHILWINLATDGLPGLMLANEPADPVSMRRPPRPRDEGLFADGSLRHVLVFGGLMAGLSLAAQTLGLHDGEAQQRTLVFTTLVCCQLGHALAVRSERLPLLGPGFFGNMPLLLTVFGSVAVQFALVYTEWGNRLLRTAPLDPLAFASACAAAVAVVAAVEIDKAALRRREAAVSSTTSR